MRSVDPGNPLLKNPVEFRNRPAFRVDTAVVGVLSGRSIASVRDTSGLRRRSVVGVGLLLLACTLTQGVTYTIDTRSEAAVEALSRINRLSVTAFDVEVLARRIEREPEVDSHRAALARAVASLEVEELAIATEEIDSAVDNPRWGRVSLALASLSDEAQGIRENAAAPNRVTQRLRARAVALADEIGKARAQVEADIERSRGWLRWLSWGSWGVMLVSIVAVSRWVLTAGLRRIEKNRAELAEAERAVLDAADGERVRLGQELHDGLCQQLGGLRLLALATKRGTDDASTQQSLDTLEGLAARALEMARALSHGLYPGDVRAVNLSAALERLGIELSELGEFTFSFEGPGEMTPEISDGDAMQLYRIAQEALSNAVRHGNPRNVQITLSNDPVTLSIEDDGVGLSSASEGSTTAGVGLSSMHARARAVNAHIEFFSTPQEGTRVVVTRSEEPIESEESLDEIPVNPLAQWTHP